MPHRLAVASLAFLALGSGQAQPTATALQQRSLAATCAACHGTDGRAQADAGLIGLQGRDKGYLLAQLTAFRNGTRPATVMQQIAKGYTPEQLDQLATYFSTQAR
ncbi:MAG TPA: cytochrome C [Rhizobacter sp.]|nr:cytochrome C [Rhizobacter sp.]